MSQASNINRNFNRQTGELTNVGEHKDDKGRGRDTSNGDSDDEFVGKEKLLEYFNKQMKEFEDWYKERDWLAFHHHHYDWWMFPIDEISSRGKAYQLPPNVLAELKQDEQFIAKLRHGVRMMVTSWGWDIDNHEYFHSLDNKQKWSYWPVRLYKAGKCMWLFGQKDYYQSLKKLAESIRGGEIEKLDYFSHTRGGKADVLEEWKRMETS
ncbi:hypothetical protein I4U23_013358 [Adineta vaga]|nr:hypothetical protein I4U23_013358 [Adineta vaga]